MARHKKLDTTMKYNRKDESYIRKYHEQNVYTIPEQEKTSPSKNIGDKLYTLQIHNISPQIGLNEDGMDNSSISFSTIFYLFFDDELVNIAVRTNVIEAIGETILGVGC
jgi:hypothetical protein